MNILGIGGILGDAASAILSGGVLAAAIEESKLSRQGLKPGAPTTAAELPEQSIAACLALAGLPPKRWTQLPWCARSPPGQRRRCT